MTIEPIVFFDLVIAIIVLATVLGAVVVYYVKTIEKFKILRIKESDIESEANKKATQILGEARSKAIKIISEANVSQNLLIKTLEEQLKSVSLNQINKLESISEEFIKIYQNALSDLKDKNIKTISNISNDIENTTRAELEDFKAIVRKETLDSQKIVESKIEQDYQLAEKELEVYKAERHKKIDEEIYNILKNISKEVLGKTISLQEHEQLVTEALEKAKKEARIE